MEVITGECVLEGFDKTLYRPTSVRLSREGQCVVAKFEMVDEKATTARADTTTTTATTTAATTTAATTAFCELPRFIARKVVPVTHVYGEDTKEYKILKECQHDNILKLFYWEKVYHLEHDTYYLHLYTELCDLNLRTFLHENKLKMSEVVILSRQLAKGCEYLHSMSVVHRDIKPENVLVYKGISPGNALLKLGDFGLSRFMPQTSDSMSSFVFTACGTAGYASPEMYQALLTESYALPGSPFSTDIFSLGVVIFEMFTGKLPFKRDELLKDFLDPKLRVESNIKEATIAKCLTHMLQWNPTRRPNGCDVVAYFNNTPCASDDDGGGPKDKLGHLSELEIFAKTLYAEAKNEPLEGQKWVAWVIKNRASMDRCFWGGSNIRDVCLHPGQFSCWQGCDDFDVPDPKALHKIWILNIYKAPMSQDPTGGCDHYNNPDKEGNPEWTKRCVRKARIGNLQFYKSK